MNPTIQYFIELGFSDSTAANLAEAMQELHGSLSCMDKREQRLLVRLCGEQGSWIWMADGLKVEANRPCNNKLEFLFGDGEGE